MRRAWASAVVLWAAGALADVFSPGELARAHESLDGISNCTQCHPVGGELSADKCLECHVELRGRVAGGKGFHGRLGPEQKQRCEGCHHDHQGRSFQMVSWGKEGRTAFDHQRTGYALEGKHAKAKCEACHEPRRIKEGAIAQMLAKQPSRQTYLGLKTACAVCHFDEHRGQLQAECEKCHPSAKTWKPAPGFEHERTNYPLKGKHQKVPCEKCHPKTKDEEEHAFPAPVSATFARYSPLEFKLCTDCHQDPHQGRFGPRCHSCHTVEGWRIVRNAGAERAFHDKTRYPLKGEHQDVDCRACHGPFPGRPARFKNMAFGACTDCHFDAHLGQLAKPKAARGPDCETCHAVDGFEPPRYDADQHAKTKYPLDGSHRVAPCVGCHPRASALGDRLPATVRRDLKLTRRKELVSLSTFELGKRAERCEGCHSDPHGGQFGRKECSGCHQVSAFSKLDKFDHTRDSRYALTGLHAKVACAKCHGADRQGVVRYKNLELACAGCHTDVHAGQLSAKTAPDCERCHTTEDWKKTKFSHLPPFTDYLLEGGHQKVACDKCHPALLVSADVSVRRYKPLARACEGCHADFHRGAFRGFVP